MGIKGASFLFHGWGRIVMTACVAVGVTIAVNVVYWSFVSDNPINTGISRLWQKWQMLERMEEPVDWVIVGDSTCGQSIRPDVIAEMTGESAANLCTIGNALLVNSAWQLQRYIERMGPPERVVALHTFETYGRNTDDLKTLLDQIPLRYGFWRRLEPSLPLSTREEIERLTRPLFALYSFNLSAQALLRNIVTGAEVSTAWGDLEFIERQGGFVGERNANPQRVADDSARVAQSRAGRSFEMTAENEAALEVMIALAERYGFQLYVANGPIAERLYADPDFRAYYDTITDKISGVIGDASNGHYIFVEPPQFPDDQLSDIEHIVGEEASRRLSRLLVEEVRRVEQVNLP